MNIIDTIKRKTSFAKLNRKVYRNEVFNKKIIQYFPSSVKWKLFNLSVINHTDEKAYIFLLLSFFYFTTDKKGIKNYHYDYWDR